MKQIYFVVYWMHFCRGEDNFGDTKCCLFTELCGVCENYAPKNNKLGLSISKLRKKHPNIVNKEERYFRKVTPHKKSQQIVKLSLSKFSGRSRSNSGQNMQQKSVSNNKSTSLASTPKAVDSARTMFSKTVLPPNPVFRNTINYHAITKITYPHQEQIRYNLVHDPKPVPKFKFCTMSEPIKPMSSRLIQPARINQWEEVPVKKNETPPHFSISMNLNKPKINNSKREKPSVQRKQSILISNAQENQNSKKLSVSADKTNLIETTALSTMLKIPTLVKGQSEYSQLNSLQISSKLKTSQSCNHPEISFSKSKFTETLSRKFGGRHLHTEQSIYSSGTNDIKQVKESIIVIDFFNPNDKVKKQIQEKIQLRNFE